MTDPQGSPERKTEANSYRTNWRTANQNNCSARHHISRPTAAYRQVSYQTSKLSFCKDNNNICIVQYLYCFFIS